MKFNYKKCAYLQVFADDFRPSPIKCLFFKKNYDKKSMNCGMKFKPFPVMQLKLLRFGGAFLSTEEDGNIKCKFLIKFHTMMTLIMS